MFLYAYSLQANQNFVGDGGCRICRNNPLCECDPSKLSVNWHTRFGVDDWTRIYREAEENFFYSGDIIFNSGRHFSGLLPFGGFIKKTSQKLIILRALQCHVSLNCGGTHNKPFTISVIPADENC